MYELTNKTAGLICFRRPDLVLNFDLAAGETVVITEDQAVAVELFANDFDITIEKSTKTAPDAKTQNVTIDIDAANLGITTSMSTDWHSAISDPLNKKAFFPHKEKEVADVVEVADEIKETPDLKVAKKTKKSDEGK